MVNVVATKKGRNRAVLEIIFPDPALDGGDELMKNREIFQMGGRINL